MKCAICKHGDTQPGTGTVVLERDATTVVFKGVPAEVCENCGEQYVDGATAARLFATAEEAVRAGVQVDIRQFVAA